MKSQRKALIRWLNHSLKLFLGLTVFGLLACQSSPKKTQLLNQEPVHRLKTQMKVIEKQADKKTIVNGLWYIQGPHTLRLDVLGPLDILMAQAFSTEHKTLFIDHRNKKIYHQEKPLLVLRPGWEIPLQDFIPMLLQNPPKAWSCSNFENQTLLCRKDQIQWQRPQENQVLVEWPELKVELTIKEQILINEGLESLFTPRPPSSYLIQKL